MCGRVWGNTAVCCRILDLCFLATPIIVKKFNNCANQLLKTNLKVIFRQEIFSVINSLGLQATLDLIFLSYRIQAILALIWAVPPEGVLIGGGGKWQGAWLRRVPWLPGLFRVEHAFSDSWSSPALLASDSCHPGQGWYHCFLDLEPTLFSPALIHVSPGWLNLPSWQRGASGLPLLCLFWIYILSWG